MSKTKLLDRITTKSLTTVFGAALFVLAFVFTFLITAAEPSLQRAHLTIIIVFCCAFGVVIIGWLVLFLILRKYKKSQDVNKQKIDKALSKLKEEAVEESKKQFDETN